MNMAVRQVIIAKDADIDFDILAKHPLVKKVWRLPRAYTLFEYYHPVFEHTWNSNYKAATAARQTEPYKSQTHAAEMETRNLLGPLYHAYAGQDYHMHEEVSRTAWYWFKGREKLTLKWPRIGHSKDWESSSTVRIAGRLFIAMPETIEGLDAVLSEWRDCMDGFGEIKRAAELRLEGDGFSADYEFAGPCGDATMALFMLLTVTRHLTSLEAVGFFLPGDFSTPFWHPRGEGEKMPQGGWASEQK
jgi:hypothetical protein